MKVLNKTSEKEKRRFLRNNMPKVEIVLWSKLKGRQLKGCKFRRQYSVDKFILDFFCPDFKLAIEVDGDTHFLNGKPERDRERQIFIENSGIRFLRFTNNDIYKNLDGVLKTIEDFIEKRGE